MKEVLKYYIEHSYQAMIHQNKLSFKFADDYFVEFTFDKILDDSIDFDDEYYSYNILRNHSDIDKLTSRILKYTSLCIKGYEDLGYRGDLLEGRSISNEMYSFVKRINVFKQNAVDKYYTTIEFGDPMCDVEGSYLFIIQLNEDLWGNIELAKFLTGNKISLVSVPNFYSVFFRKNEPIKDNKSIPILSTNTKVRRIGYFKILSAFLIENGKIPSNLINKKFESYCLNFTDSLEKNQYNKGLIIETKTGISAKPYIDTSNDLGLINKINKVYYSGKAFKVFQALQSDYSNSPNVFELFDFDRIYFLECILRNDYFYFKTLLELLYIEELTTYSALVKVFQNSILARLESYKHSNSYGDRNRLNNIDIILKRIKKWEKAEVYLEHILMPRLNWMLDLGIVKDVKDGFEITEVGSKLFQHLCIWNDINTEEIISPNAFLDRFMIHLFDDSYHQSKAVNPKNVEIIQDKVFENIDKSFGLFKTLAPNRVTASQAVNYTKYKLYLEDNIKVGYQYIMGVLAKKGQDRFIFKYQEQYQDGYIQKK